MTESVGANVMTNNTTKIELAKYGWLMFYGVVTFNKEWCYSCCQARYHETALQKMCIACANVVEESQPGFQIERFIKGDE